MKKTPVVFAIGTSFWVRLNGKLHLVGTPTGKHRMIEPCWMLVAGQVVYFPKFVRIN